jgi:hypothetical protein
MRNLEALTAALAMLQRPQLVAMARSAPLPQGVNFVLEIAAGELGALDNAEKITGEHPAKLNEAARFFIEQIMLAAPSDHYRILGAEAKTSSADLRRNMALIMKWLHPDTAAKREPGELFDRSIYAHRVAAAWESLKTGTRRAAYDASGTGPAGSPTSGMQRAKNPGRTTFPAYPRRRHKRLVIYRLSRETIWNRLLLLFKGNR